jgi:hypothetical protein
MPPLDTALIMIMDSCGRCGRCGRNAKVDNSLLFRDCSRYSWSKELGPGVGAPSLRGLSTLGN